MKALYTREFYQRNWDRFIKRVPGENYINLEEELDRAMRTYKDAGIPEQALGIIEKVEAAKIIERADKLVRKQLEVLKRIETGEASLGYTTQLQEIHARAEFHQRFEFNCYQLAVFREKYNS